MSVCAIAMCAMCLYCTCTLKWQCPFVSVFVTPCVSMCHCIHVHLWVLVSVCVWVSTGVCMCQSILCVCIYIYQCLYVSVFACHCVCVCMSVSVCVCVRVMRPGARSRAEQSWWLLVSAGPGQSHPGPINKSGPAAAPSHPPGYWTPEVSCPSLPTKT